MLRHIKSVDIRGILVRVSSADLQCTLFLSTPQDCFTGFRDTPLWHDAVEVLRRRKGRMGTKADYERVRVRRHMGVRSDIRYASFLTAAHCITRLIHLREFSNNAR